MNYHLYFESKSLLFYLGNKQLNIFHFVKNIFFYEQYFNTNLILIFQFDCPKFSLYNPQNSKQYISYQLKNLHFKLLQNVLKYLIFHFQFKYSKLLIKSQMIQILLISHLKKNQYIILFQCVLLVLTNLSFLNYRYLSLFTKYLSNYQMYMKLNYHLVKILHNSPNY